MRMNSKFLIYALVFLLAINLTALLTLAYNRLFFQKKNSPESEEITDSLQEELKLSPQQKEKLKTHRSVFRQEIQPFLLEIQEKEKLLLKEIQSEKPKLNHINTLVEEISQLRAEIQKQAVKRLIKEKSILNPAQCKHYFSIFEQNICGHGEKTHHRERKEFSNERRKKKEIKEESCLNQMLFH